MAETSLPWANTGVGDGQAYNDDEWSDTWRKLFTVDRTVQGVIPGYANELAVSNSGGVTIRVATGAAVVDGKFYESTANVDNTVVAPGAGSNYYRIVLRKSWAGQTVRVAMLGPNAVAPDAVTQNDGTTWEISLATVQITSAGAITVTDTRRFTEHSTTMVAARQGGHATAWGVAGDTNYYPGRVRIQTGTKSVTITNGNTFAAFTITYPITFTYTPVLMLTYYCATAARLTTVFTWSEAEGNAFGIAERAGAAGDVTFGIRWLAIGSL